MASEGITCIVPARGNSKGILGKNLIELGGRPLLVWTVEAALKSCAINRLILSTDNEEIAQVARNAGAEVPFERPSELARDEVHAVHVVLHALDWLEKREKNVPEGVMMLLPTSPLRRPDDIRKVVDLFRKRNAASVVSVVDIGKYMNNLRFLNEEKLEVAVPGEDLNAQRQGYDKLYGVNGSIFLARPKELRGAETFHMEGALGYVMNPLNSIDINDMDDLNFARKILSATNLWL